MSKSKKSDLVSKETKMKLPLAALKEQSLKREASPCNNCYNEIMVSEQIDYLDLESVVVKMITNYQSQQYELITNPNSTLSTIEDDARSVYFSLNKLKSFIFEIERLCCQRSCNDQLGELGIRFYYGAYNNSLPLPDSVTDQYQGKHTLVLVPTYTKNIDGVPVHVDFSPDRFELNSDGTPSCNPVSLEQVTTSLYSTLVDTASDHHAALRIKKDVAKKSSKIMALIGGYQDKNQKQMNMSRKMMTKKGKIPGTGDSTPPVDTTIMNHGDLIPPPSKSSATRYTDATLLNCE
jgi:hypothetical protein